MKHRIKAAALACLFVSSLGLGCAFGELRFNDPLDREYSLENMQKRYTDLVRFSNFDAASRYLAIEDRKAYLKGLPREDRLRFLDYEIEPVHINEELNHALVRVVYTAYSPWTLVEFTVVERQEWSRPKGLANAWTVKSEFEGLEAFRHDPRRSARL